MAEWWGRYRSTTGSGGARRLPDAAVDPVPAVVVAVAVAVLVAVVAAVLVAVVVTTVVVAVVLVAAVTAAVTVVVVVVAAVRGPVRPVVAVVGPGEPGSFGLGPLPVRLIRIGPVRFGLSSSGRPMCTPAVLVVVVTAGGRGRALVRPA